MSGKWLVSYDYRVWFAPRGTGPFSIHPPDSAFEIVEGSVAVWLARQRKSFSGWHDVLVDGGEKAPTMYDPEGSVRHDEILRIHCVIPAEGLSEDEVESFG